MIEDDRERFAEAWCAAQLMYDRVVVDAQLEMAWRVLEKYDIDDVLGALTIHLADPDQGRFFPKPSDIIRAIDGTVETKAAMAWTYVEKAIRHRGSYESPDFGDNKIHQIIKDMGGWILLCQTLEKDLPFKRKEFETRFRGYQHTVFDEPVRLTGRVQLDRQQHGLEGPLETKLIEQVRKLTKNSEETE